MIRISGSDWEKAWVKLTNSVISEEPKLFMLRPFYSFVAAGLGQKYWCYQHHHKSPSLSSSFWSSLWSSLQSSLWDSLMCVAHVFVHSCALLFLGRLQLGVVRIRIILIRELSFSLMMVISITVKTSNDTGYDEDTNQVIRCLVRFPAPLWVGEPDYMIWWWQRGQDTSQCCSGTVRHTGCGTRVHARS